MNELSENFRIASKKLTSLKKIDEQKAKEITERKYLIGQIIWDIDNCNFKGIMDSDEVKIMISRFDARLETFYKNCCDLERVFGGEINGLGFNVENEQLIASVREKLAEGQARLFVIKAEKEFLLKEKREMKEKGKINVQQIYKLK